MIWHHPGNREKSGQEAGRKTMTKRKAGTDERREKSGHGQRLVEMVADKIEGRRQAPF